MKNHKFFRIFFFFSFMLLTDVYVSGQFDWTMANGNASRTAMVDFEDILAPPLQESQGIPLSCEHLVIKGEIAYIINGGSPAILIAFNLNEWVEIWRYEIQETAGSIGFVPAISGDIILISGQNANGLYALDRFSGEERWFKAMQNPYGKNPIADDRGHYYLSDINTIICIKANTGETVWEQVRIQGYCTPTLFQDKVLVPSLEYINALDTSDGSFVWQIPDLDANRGHIMAEDSFIYASIQDKVCAYKHNQEMWCYEFPEEFYAADFNSGRACLTENLVISSIWDDGTGHSKLLALDKETGTLVWEYTSDTKGISAPSSANGVVYVAGFLKSWIIGFEEATGKILYEYTGPTFWGHPIIASHKLWIPASSNISVFEAKPSSMTKPEPNNDLVKVYPNPFEHKIYIRTNQKSEEDLSLQLYNVLGEKVLERLFYSSDGEIHLETNELKPGVYFLTAQNDKEELCKKLIKQ